MKLKSTASSREPGDFLADEVALIMRSEQVTATQNGSDAIKDLSTLKLPRSDEQKPPLAPGDRVPKHFKARNNSTLPEMELKMGSPQFVPPKYQRNSAIVGTMMYSESVMQVTVQEKPPFGMAQDYVVASKGASYRMELQIKSREFKTTTMQDGNYEPQQPYHTDSKTN